MAFQLDERLRNDCVVLGQLEFSWLLLLNNIDVPWFILVPETTVAEVIDLPPGERAVLRAELDRSRARSSTWFAASCWASSQYTLGVFCMTGSLAWLSLKLSDSTSCAL